MGKDIHTRPFLLTESGILSTQIASSPPGECPYTLFLGAGASSSSGVPHVNALIEDWKKEVFCHLKGLSVQVQTDNYHVPLPADKYKEYVQWERDHYQDWVSDLKYYLHSSSDYGTLFQHTRKTREERQMFVEQLVSNKSPSPGYMYLSGIINNKRFNRILTTNFDDILNDALVKYYNIKPINCAFDSAVTSFNNSSLRPKIIKLHGDFLYDNIRNTDEEVLDLGENMEDKMVEMCEDKGLIVIGYDGHDESIMVPIRENLRKNKKFLTKGIHWCIFDPAQQHESMYINEDQIPEHLRVIRKRYPGRVFLYSITGFDKFMESIFIKCGLTLPETILLPYQNNVANDFYESCEKLEKRERLTPQMREHMDMALERMEKTPDKNQFKVRRAYEKWRYGADLRDNEKEYESSLEQFQEAIEIVSNILQLDDTSNLLKLQSLTRKLGCHIGIAKVLHKLNKPCSDEMEHVYKITDNMIAIESEVKLEEEIDTLVSIYYNIICALGFESKLAGGVTEEIRNKVLELVDKLKIYRPEKIDKLILDTDTELIRALLK